MNNIINIDFIKITIDTRKLKSTSRLRFNRQSFPTKKLVIFLLKPFKWNISWKYLLIIAISKIDF